MPSKARWSVEGKTCKDCEQLLPLTAFSEHKARNGRALTYHPRCFPCAAKKTAVWREELKSEVFVAYGSACNCCGETERVFLALDHVHGGGRKHRASVGGDNMGVYKDARDRGFPDDFQLLCHNCNMAKHLLGECPHMTCIPN